MHVFKVTRFGGILGGKPLEFSATYARPAREPSFYVPDALGLPIRVAPSPMPSAGSIPAASPPTRISPDGTAGTRPARYRMACSTATATATEAPTMGLLPMPIRPIISTWAGTEDEPANWASECMRPMVSVMP